MVNLPPTIKVWVLQAIAAWPNKRPDTKSTPKPNPARRLRIDPPSEQDQIKTKQAHRVSQRLKTIQIPPINNITKDVY